MTYSVFTKLAKKHQWSLAGQRETRQEAEALAKHLRGGVQAYAKVVKEPNQDGDWRTGIVRDSHEDA